MTLQERLHDLAVLMAEVRTHQKRDREAFEDFREESQQAHATVTAEVRQLRESELQRAARNAAYGGVGGLLVALVTAAVGCLK